MSKNRMAVMAPALEFAFPDNISAENSKFSADIGIHGIQFLECMPPTPHTHTHNIGNASPVPAIRGRDFQAIGQVTLFNHDLSLPEICLAAFLSTKSSAFSRGGNTARRSKILRPAHCLLSLSDKHFSIDGNQHHLCFRLVISPVLQILIMIQSKSTENYLYRYTIIGVTEKKD